jgi:EpsI family protein
MRLLGSMALVALATNWVRVLLLLLIGYLGGMNNAIISRDHLQFGYVLFVIVLVAFVWVSTRRPLPEPEAKPLIRTPSRVSGGFIAALLALVALPILVSHWAQRSRHETNAAEVRLPAGQNAWRGPLPALDDDWHPVFVGAHTQQHAAYQDAGGHTVEAMAVGYEVQEQGRELINEGNSLLGNGDLSPLTATFVDAGGSTFLEMVAVDKAGNRSVIWSLYDIGGKTFVVPLLSQLWYGVHALASPPYSAQFAFRAACSVSCDTARETLRNFVQGMGVEVLSVVNRAISRGSAVTPRRHPSVASLEAPP